jgi:type I restriction enzyme S subunit
VRQWSIAKLKYVARFVYGDPLPIDREVSEDVPVYGSNGVYAFHSVANTKGPAIIVGRKGSYGKVNWSNGPCFASDTTFFIDETTTQKNLRWVYWLLQTLRLDEGSDEAAVPGLNRETAYENIVAIPPASQQRAIADYLDRETMKLDSLVAAKERLLVLLADKRRALITCGVTRGLNPEVTLRDSGLPWIGQIPAHWAIMKLKHVAFLKSGDAITSDSITESGEYPVYGGNGIRGYTSSFTHNGDYVLIGRQGALCGNINIASGRFWASEHAVVVHIQGENDFNWLGELLQIMNLNQYSQSAAQPGLAVGFVANLQVPIPPLPEQRLIVAHIRRETAKVDTLKVAAERTTGLLKERRAALIAAAVTGKIKPLSSFAVGTENWV